MLIEHPFYLDSNEILNLDLQRGHSFKPFVIQENEDGCDDSNRFTICY